MSIFRDSQGLYRSSRLAGLPWLEHAFGTARAAPEPGYLFLHQVHSAQVLDASGCLPGAEGDALLTATPGVRLAVKTADCVPILIADPLQRAVAAVHAGWRGTLARIAGAAVARMIRAHGSNANTLIAALGPSIGPCCYEVGPDLAGEFQSIVPVTTGHSGRPHIDLRQANRRLLIDAGLHPFQIDDAPPCTFCGGAEFHSWRRDRLPGARMFSVIGILRS